MSIIVLSVKHEKSRLTACKQTTVLEFAWPTRAMSSSVRPGISRVGLSKPSLSHSGVRPATIITASDDADSSTAASSARSGSIFSHPPSRYDKPQYGRWTICVRVLTTPRIRAGCDLSASGPSGGWVLVYSTSTSTARPATKLMLAFSSTVPWLRGSLLLYADRSSTM